VPNARSGISWDLVNPLKNLQEPIDLASYFGFCQKAEDKSHNRNIVLARKLRTEIIAERPKLPWLSGSFCPARIVALAAIATENPYFYRQ
jgi:hypothetical protein